MRRLSLPLILVLTAALALPSISAWGQAPTGALCVATYADANGNGMRDSDEGVLAGVNVNLATAGVIIATHIIEAPETQYCFENLLTGIYTITFTDSPMYRTTTANEGTFKLDAGQRLMINDFGAFPISASSLRAEVAAQIAAERDDEQPLEPSMRLMLATVGSMVVMIFLVGIGAVLLGLISGRPAKKNEASKKLPPTVEVNPPTNIQPPAF